ncbi:MAG: hypothetical protein WBX19_04225 [Terracidiphilus sp.]|jgi:hypothetical protein
MGQPPATAKAGVDYPIAFHISGIHVRTPCKGETCNDVVYADAIVDGKRIELMGDWIWYPNYSSVALFPGDYKGRLFKDSKKNAGPIFQQYELLLRENTIWRCTVTGVYE